MLATRSILFFAAALIFATAAPPFVRPATAGCGCDHPPPAYQPVMPSFGAPGKTIRIFAEGSRFRVFGNYRVTFTSVPASLTGVLNPSVTVAALRGDSIQVKVPSNLKVGPISLRVTGPGYDKTYSPDLFTALPLPRKLPTGDASILIKTLAGAVTTDGTLLIPVDLSDILDPTQFAFMLTNLPLAYGPDDVVFYNRDGVDLTLFTLNVDDPTSRQWGSYYGWQVEDDASMSNLVYDNKVVLSPRPDAQSDLLTYWRHEFYTYKTAHGSGGTHYVDANGYHRDGTLHIDHGMLVLAIDGKLRDANAPNDASKMKPLAPGARSVDLLVTAAITNDPIEPSVMAARAQASPAYSESLAFLNERLAGLTGQTGSVGVSKGPLGTTLGTALNPLSGKK